jgi:hypothetical protein
MLASIGSKCVEFMDDEFPKKTSLRSWPEEFSAMDLLPAESERRKRKYRYAKRF